MDMFVLHELYLIILYEYWKFEFNIELNQKSDYTEMSG